MPAYSAAGDQSAAECLVDVPDRIQLGLDRARIDAMLVGRQRRMRRVAGANRIERGLAGQHPAAHREVDALQAHRVHEIRRVPDDQRAIDEQVRLRIPSAFRQRLGAVAHERAAFEDAADERMTLEMLEGGMRIEQRILVVEADDEADRDAAVGHRIQPAAAEFFLAQRIAERVDDGPGLQPILRECPTAP